MFKHRSWILLNALCACVCIASSNSAAASNAVKVGCEPDGDVPVTVSLRAPSGASLAGVKVTLGYPKGRVGIPGFMNAPEVQARVTEVPKDFLMAPNDTDDALIVSLAGLSVLPTGRIFRVRFDRCKDSTPVEASDFHCTIDEASDQTAHLVNGATCAVAIPTARAD